MLQNAQKNTKNVLSEGGRADIKILKPTESFLPLEIFLTLILLEGEGGKLSVTQKLLPVLSQ